MTVFAATLNQTAFLFSFIVLGYILVRVKAVPAHSQHVLSKLENTVFIPALVLGTFIDQFTVEKVTSASKLLLGSLMLEVVVIALSFLCIRIMSRDRYERNIYQYGLCFSNFGFMGNAVVSALFPDIFMEYLIFTLPLWTLIYMWGAPVLLMGDEKASLKTRLKSFLNPMLVCTVLGMIIGITGLKLPSFIGQAVSAAGNCMSPIAMLITGMTLAQMNLKEILRIRGVYVSTFFRLIVFPALFLLAACVIPFGRTFATCAICSLAMPLGLNTVIIPAAQGKDTRVASGMALVSHLLSCLTIPVVFMIFEMLMK